MSVRAKIRDFFQTCAFHAVILAGRSIKANNLDTCALLDSPGPHSWNPNVIATLVQKLSFCI